MELTEGQPEGTHSIGRSEYRIGEANIAVTWKAFEPTTPAKEVEGIKRAVLYIPGYSITEQANSVVALAQAFADNSHSTTYAVGTKSDRIDYSSLSEEAEAVRQFIEGKGLTAVTLVGNSQGGAEAIHLASLLQEQNPKVTIEGLILLDSIGLYSQQGSELLVNYAKDVAGTVIRTGIEAGKALFRRPLMKKRGDQVLPQMQKYAPDGISEILREVRRFGTQWPRRTISEIREMVADISPVTKGIKAPIVIIQGANDLALNPNRIIPPQSPVDADKGYIQGIGNREQFLQENLFPKSESVTMIVPERHGVHSVSYLRPGAVAKSALELLRRSKKTSA